MPFPATVPVLATIAGVAAGVAARIDAGLPLLLAVLCWAVALAGYRAGRPKASIAAALAGFVLAGAALGGAGARRALHPPLLTFHAPYDEDGRPGPLLLDGRLREDASDGDFGVAITLDVERVRTPCGWMPARGGVRLSVSGVLAAARRDAWRAGRRVRATASLRRPGGYRNPGAGDEDLALARRGLALLGSVKSAALVEVTEHGHALAEAASAVRSHVRRTIAAALPDRPLAAAIVTAILIGDRGGLPADVRRRLQAAGTYHVIAISGGNIAILAAVCLALLRAARAGRRTSAVILALALSAYGYVAGGGPSVGRATLAATLYLLARAADHRAPALNALAVVALAAVVREPLEVFDPGLWLSYGATLAILTVAEAMLRRWRKRHASGSIAAVALALASILAGTVAAELALFPVAAYVFQRVTLAGIVLNFAAIPLMSAAQIAGLATVLLSWWPALAHAPAQLAGLAAAGLVESARLPDVMPMLAWRVPAPPAWLLAAYYAGWALLLSARGARVARLPSETMRTARLALAGAVALAAAAIASPVQIRWLTAVPAAARGELRVTFLDAGQGDAVLVELPGGRSLLVDAGGLPGASTFDIGDRVIGPALLASGVRRLDYLAITHGDPDHAGGALAIARDFAPRELWEGVPVPPHAQLRALREHLSRRGAALRLVRPGDRLLVGGVELRVLHPPEPDWERQRVRNDDSIVLEVRYGDVSIVLPGDIGGATERALAATLDPAPLRVLKAAHHGSASSTTAAWLDALRPAAVVFSCGRANRFGHPAAPVLARVRARGAAIYRTDEDGAVTVTTDGREARVRTFSGRESRLRSDKNDARREDPEGRKGRQGGHP